MEKCLPQCDVSDYTFDTTYAKFPNPNVAHLMAAQNVTQTAEYMRDNFVEIRVTMEIFEEQHIRVELKYKILNTLAEAGGMLGLFIGASMISFVEIVELLIQISCTATEMAFSRRQMRMKRVAPELVEDDNAVTAF